MIQTYKPKFKIDDIVVFNNQCIPSHASTKIIGKIKSIHFRETPFMNYKTGFAYEVSGKTELIYEFALTKFTGKL